MKGIYDVSHAFREDERGVKFNIFIIGNNTPIDTRKFVELLINALIKVGLVTTDCNIDDNVDYLERQPGDVDMTYAHINKIMNEINWHPKVNAEQGLLEFAKWYREYYEK